MQKFDQEKPRIDLVPSVLITEVAKVLGFGADKYEANQWREGTDWNRFYAAAMRHLLAWNEGETNDPESGINHLSHAACSLGFLLEYTNSKLGNDHRVARSNSDIPSKPIASLSLGKSETYPEVGTSSIPDHFSNVEKYIGEEVMPIKKDIGISMADLPKLVDINDYYEPCTDSYKIPALEIIKYKKPEPPLGVLK